MHEAYQALRDRILTGPGQASADLRARAFGNAGLSPPLDELLGKVATSPTRITDADFAAARAAGFSEDELFELVICAAFNTTTPLADAFGFEVLSPEGFDSGAKYLLKRGYR